MVRNKTTRSQTDPLQSYFDQIKDTPLLTFEEELELSKKIQAGNLEARQKLIEANLKLVVKIARSFKTNDVSFLDLIQEGNLGLMKAADRFDFRKNVRFSTYASWWIKQSIVRSLSNKRRAIRLPHRKEEKLRKINKTINALSQKLMRTPDMHEVAVELGIDEKEIINILTISNHIVSLDSETNDMSGTLQEVLEDYSYDPDRELMQKNLHEETLKHLDRLRKKEKEIILYRYSFYGGKKCTLKTIGARMGISPETVRQIEMRALSKLKENAEELREYCIN
ncbi:MAG: RNA polymerase sigma factor RpoD/SigA [Spirochaetales bacterium]|nr:RNA polymerase sigma factor RpoD/SigA [Spirochaetales bacterium]